MAADRQAALCDISAARTHFVLDSKCFLTVSFGFVSSTQQLQVQRILQGDGYMFLFSPYWVLLFWYFFVVPAELVFHVRYIYIIDNLSCGGN